MDKSILDEIECPDVKCAKDIIKKAKKLGAKEELSRQRFEQGKLNINFVKFLRKEISGTEFALAMEQRIKDIEKRLSELDKGVL